MDALGRRLGRIAKLTRTQGIVYRRIFAEVIVYILPHWHTNYLLKEAVAAYTN